MPDMTRRSILRSGAVAAGTVAAGAAVPHAAAAAPTADWQAPPRKRGTVRVLTWNIYRGGLGEGGEANLNNLLDQMAALRPDIYLGVETYGSGDRIRSELSRRAGLGKFTGIKVTDAAPGYDNLWIFTHLPIVKVHPKPAGGTHVGDFNLGSVRVRVPGGKELDAFVAWFSYTDPWVGYLIDENAAGIRAGLQPRHPAADVAAADRLQTAYAKETFGTHLPAMLGDSTRPVVIGGDFNTLPASEWTAANKDKTNHFGMSYDLAATKVITDAGFIDTFRAVHPDVEVEGRTWSPLPRERLITPQRIDMIFAKGDVTVRDAAVVDTRMHRHGPGDFYSDHAATYTDLHIG